MTIEELKSQKQWIIWCNQNGNKIPISPITQKPTGANESHKHQWTTFDEAKKIALKHDGVGLILCNGISGIDIDNYSFDNDMVQEIITLMDTYVEKSPSGKGYHILFKCDISKIPTSDVLENNVPKKKLNSNYYQKNPKLKIECYIADLTNRYFTFTEEVVVNKPINERTEQLITFLNKYMLKTTNNVEDNFDEIINLILKSKQANKFKKIYYDGDISIYDNDDSSADMALCNILAFYTQGDYDIIDKLFSKSALYRDKWNRLDYKNSTINKAISICGNEFYKRPGRPISSVSANSNKSLDKKVFTIEELKTYLNEKKISLKYNVITKKVDIFGLDERHSREHLQDLLPTIIHSDIKKEFKYCDIAMVRRYLDVISTDNSYNPVLEKLNSIVWDGKDYFKELVSILNIEEDELSCTLLYKWLWQCLSICKNNLDSPFGADGMLVLIGSQGIGKTTFVKIISMNEKFCSIGNYINFYDKDTSRRACSYWIVELGEIETTLRSDIEKLKAFITNEVDEYRLPYGASDLTIIRRTSLIGTCNSFEYLIDRSGNRRFWTIPVVDIDLKRLSKFNAEQLWGQIINETKNDIQGFRLTKEEQNKLYERNTKHEKQLKGEAEILDILSLNMNNTKEMTITEFQEEHEVLKKYSVQQIGQVLNKLDINQSIVNGRRVRKLPTFKQISFGLSRQQ